MILTYDIALDFTNGVHLPSLSEELAASFHPVLSLNAENGFVSIGYSIDKTPTEINVINGVISAHTGVKPPDTSILETIMLIPTDQEVKNSNDWQDFGGVIVSGGGFGINKDNIKAQITGQYKIKSGNDAEVCLLETGSWNMLPDVELMQPHHILQSSNDMWLPFTTFTNVDIRDGYWAYVFRARAGSCDGFYLRYLTMSIVEIE